MNPTPTKNSLAHRVADFSNLCQALDYAAQGITGFNFYNGRGELYSTLPYQALQAAAVKTAQGMVAKKIPIGSRILIIADTVPDFTILFFACQYASLIAVPVNLPVGLGGKDSYIAGLRRQIQDCGAYGAASPQELIEFLKLATQDLDVKMVGAYQDFISLPNNQENIRPWLGKDDPCYLQYSSGSTRFPCGVDLRQSNVMANMFAISAHGLQVKADDRSCSWLPLYHDMGLVGMLLSSLANQLSADFIATRDFAKRPLLWPELMARNQATISYSPSFGYDLCLRRAMKANLTGLDLRSWKAAGIGGDMVQPAVLEEFGNFFAPYGFRKTSFVPSYGMAETTLALSFSPLGHGAKTDYVDRLVLADHSVAKAVPQSNPNSRAFIICGRALPLHEIHIRNDQGERLKDRQLGKIFAKGPSVMHSYFQKPAETKAVLSADGWLDTGDLGYRLGDEIVITGRSKDLIIIHGRNIWPQDIEWALETLPDIKKGDTAAFAIQAENNEEKIVVLVECRLQDSLLRQQLVHEATAIIRRTCAADSLVVLVQPRSLPHTSSGKLSRSKAKANYLADYYQPTSRSS